MTLTQLFTAIANAIRAKKGTSGTIIASNFPTEIANITTGVDTTDANAVANDIVTGKTAYVNNVKLTGTYTGIVPTGTKSITQNGQVDVSNYASANVNVPTPTPSLQSKSIEITENGTTTITPDSGYDGLDEVEVITNVSGGTSEYNAKVVTTPISTSYTTFPATNRFLKEFPAIDLTGFTTCQNFFGQCNYLEKVELFDTSNCQSMNSMFINCERVVTVPEFNTTRVTNLQNAFTNCPSLSNESLNNILAMCYKSAVTSNRNLQKIGLSSAQADICETLPNWNAYIAGGWFKGY